MRFSILYSSCIFFCLCYGDHRDLHVLTHSFPTRRASDRSVPDGRARTRVLPDAASRCLGRLVVRYFSPRFRCVLFGYHRWQRSEENTSELQSLMRISYAVFCLKKTKANTLTPDNTTLTLSLMFLRPNKQR